MTLIAKLVAITRPLVTYREPPVKGLITEVIPHGPEHACVWIYIYLFFIIDYRNLLMRCPQNCIWVTSELLLSHLGIAFESPSSKLRLRQLGITFESPRNYVWATSELRLNEASQLQLWIVCSRSSTLLPGWFSVFRNTDIFQQRYVTASIGFPSGVGSSFAFVCSSETHSLVLLQHTWWTSACHQAAFQVVGTCARLARATLLCHLSGESDPVAGASPWLVRAAGNSLPPTIRCLADQPETFKKALKTYFMQQYWLSASAVS